MKTLGEVKHDIYIVLKQEINATKNKFILLSNLFGAVEMLNSDMPVFLQSPEGQVAFLSAINTLVTEQRISSVGEKINHNGLYAKYRVNKKDENKDNHLITEIIRCISLPASLDYYVKYPEDYLKDKDVIDIILNCIKKESHSIVTVNERAYELFGDEKFFKGDDKRRSRGETVLRRLGLDYQYLGCYETVEPFFSFCKKDFYIKNSRNIYIIENKDTFWSLKNFFMDSATNYNFDMLIYGEGKKILSSFKFVEEYEINPQIDTFFYFGDLDPEGVNIYCDLKNKFHEYNIKPFYKGYNAIFEIGLAKGLAKTQKKQNICEDNIEMFIKDFDENLSVNIKKILYEGFYIPQEALSAKRIKERFGS